LRTSDWAYGKRSAPPSGQAQRPPLPNDTTYLSFLDD